MTPGKKTGVDALRAILMEELTASLDLTRAVVSALALLDAKEDGRGDDIAAACEGLEEDSCALCHGLGRLSSVEWPDED